MAAIISIQKENCKENEPVFSQIIRADTPAYISIKVENDQPRKSCAQAERQQWLSDAELITGCGERHGSHSTV
jgi:hypothetical protein